MWSKHSKKNTSIVLDILLENFFSDYKVKTAYLAVFTLFINKIISCETLYSKKREKIFCVVKYYKMAFGDSPE